MKAYHLSHLEELKMILEHESWQLWPVKATFSIFKLHEYKFLKENKCESASVIGESVVGEIKRGIVEASVNSYIVDILSLHNPFDLSRKRTVQNPNETKIVERSNSSENEESDSEADDDSDDNSDSKNMLSLAILISKNKRNSDTFKLPMLTNTTLNIMRLYGKYIQMLSIFRIISNDVISYLMQLFYFYFYYIYMHFAQGEVNLSNDTSIQAIVKTIRNELFVQSKYNMNEPQIAVIKTMKNRQEYLSCIQERMVAAESLVFLSQQLENIFPLINEYLPATPNKNLDVYLNILKETMKMRAPIYMHISKVAIDYALISESIVKINWDLHDLMSQHNTYVDIMHRQLQQFVTDVESLRVNIPVEKKTVNIFLEQCIKIIMRTLVEGYASLKKCSNEGRALMQLDFQQFIVKLEKICELRPIPDKDYVEVYIKAFYLPDSSLEKWVKEHPEYSQKSIVGLLNLMAQVTRKTKANIIASFESSN